MKRKHRTNLPWDNLSNFSSKIVFFSAVWGRCPLRTVPFHEAQLKITLERNIMPSGFQWNRVSFYYKLKSFCVSERSMVTNEENYAKLKRSSQTWKPWNGRQTWWHTAFFLCVHKRISHRILWRKISFLQVLVAPLDCIGCVCVCVSKRVFVRLHFVLRCF